MLTELQRIGVIYESIHTPTVWYHVSTKYLGDIVVMDPKRAGQNWGAWRGVPRVAVAPSVGQCIAATGIPKQGDVYAYATHQLPSPPQGSIDDVKVTGEMWFLDDIEMRFVGTIDGQELRTKYKPFVPGFPSQAQIDFVKQFNGQ